MSVLVLAIASVSASQCPPCYSDQRPLQKIRRKGDIYRLGGLSYVRGTGGVGNSMGIVVVVLVCRE